MARFLGLNVLPVRLVLFFNFFGDFLPYRSHRFFLNRYFKIDCQAYRTVWIILPSLGIANLLKLNFIFVPFLLLAPFWAFQWAFFLHLFDQLFVLATLTWNWSKSTAHLNILDIIIVIKIVYEIQQLVHFLVILLLGLVFGKSPFRFLFFFFRFGGFGSRRFILFLLLFRWRFLFFLGFLLWIFLLV